MPYSLQVEGNLPCVELKSGKSKIPSMLAKLGNGDSN